MAMVKQKEAVGRRVRVVNSSCTHHVRCEVKEGKHTIITDEPAERGGEDTGAAPLMHLAAAFAACQTVQTVKVAEAMRFKHGAINIEARCTTDLVDGIEGNSNGVTVHRRRADHRDRDQRERAEAGAPESAVRGPLPRWPPVRRCRHHPAPDLECPAVEGLGQVRAEDEYGPRLGAVFVSMSFPGQAGACRLC
jgi:uncharacterized OsmC-like protein